MAYQDNGYELDWNGTIEHDAPEFTVLPEGDYDFQVVKLERARHPGSSKLPPCNKAVLHIQISDEGGVNIIRHNLSCTAAVRGCSATFSSALVSGKRASASLWIGARWWAQKAGQKLVSVHTARTAASIRPMRLKSFMRRRRRASLICPRSRRITTRCSDERGDDRSGIAAISAGG